MGRANRRVFRGRLRPQSQRRIIPVRALYAPDRRERYERHTSAIEQRRLAAIDEEMGSSGEADASPGDPFILDCPRAGREVSVGRHITTNSRVRPALTVRRNNEQGVSRAFLRQADLELGLARRAVCAITPPSHGVSDACVGLVYALVRGNLDSARGSVAHHAVSDALSRTHGSVGRRNVRFIHDFLRAALCPTNFGPDVGGNIDAGSRTPSNS